jgi:hypothetical protein
LNNDQHAPQVPAEAKPTEGGEGVREVEVDSINTDAVLVSTHALVPFDLGTPEFSQGHYPAPSESPSQKNNDIEEDEGKNERMSKKIIQERQVTILWENHIMP